jgi:tricorn protease interacting factor F2/3
LFNFDVLFMVNKRQVLGDNSFPLNYVLEFEPNMKTFTYKCKETITIQIKKSTKSIKLNAANLKINKATISAKRKVQSAKITSNKDLEEITLTFNEAVLGTAQIKMEFEGKNNDTLRGFYRSKYSNNGKEGYILTSQFEPNDARDAFPCFDEPGFKSTFDISFIIDKDLSAVSNMPIFTEEKAANGKKLVTFMTSPRMSCYLVYLGVGKFEFSSSKPSGLPEIRIITTPGKSNQTQMALEMTAKFLRYYNSYFGIKYPLPKLDILAIPDFAASAMENWGAMAFRELAILGDEKTTSLAVRQRIAEVIAHELAHQWFGDLVTMKWWDDLWLNESFATFMSYKAIQHVYPEWQTDIQATVNKTTDAMGADQISSTQQVGMKVNSPADMSIAFDPSIVYSKGGCLLSMFEDYVTNDIFRKGLHKYLIANQYSNAQGSDLWKSISEASGPKKKSLKFDKVASYWIENSGFPIIDVKYHGSKIEMDQKRFLLIPKDDKRTWPIPVHYIKKDGKGKEEGRMLLERKSTSADFSKLDYIKLNYMQKGFYRVRYPDKILERLGNLIKNDQLDALDGWGIENDLFALARASRIKVASYLTFVERYCMKSRYPLDSSVLSHLNVLALLLCDNISISKRIKLLILRYGREILERVGWNESKGERSRTTLLRGAAIASLGQHGDMKVIAKAKELFDNYWTNGTPINKNLRGAIYSVNAYNGNETTYNRFLELYRKEKSVEEKVRLLQMFPSFNDPEILKKALELTFSKEVRLHDAASMAAIAAVGPIGKKLIWEWTRQRWPKILELYKGNSRVLISYVNNLGILDDEKSKREIGQFLSKKANMREEIKLALPRTIERIGGNLRFRQYNDT